jgi:hypothetical protein
MYGDEYAGTLNFNDSWYRLGVIVVVLVTGAARVGNPTGMPSTATILSPGARLKPLG